MEAAPSDNLYVQGLPADSTNETITAMFGEGVRQCKILPPSPKFATRVALVRMSSADEATMIKAQFDGAVPEGSPSPLSIRYAGKPWEQNGQGGSWGKAGGGMQPDQASPYGGGKGAASPNDCLYVKGLPAGMTSEVVTQMFAQHGTVTQTKVLDAPPGSTSCHALVRFASVEEAAAVKELFKEGGQMEGVDEPISVDFKTQPGGGSWAKGGDGEAKGGGKGDGKCGMADIFWGIFNLGCLPGTGVVNAENCLYVAGLPSDCDDLYLYKLFGPFGAIVPKGVTAMKDPEGNCKGIGFVNYVNVESVTAAAALLDGLQCPDGNILKVKQKDPKGM